MNRFAFALIVMIAACAGEPSQPEPPPDVDPNAIPEVVSLSAAMSVLPDQSTAIAYEVKNARAIEISVGDRSVLSTFANQGSVDSGPLRHDSIITLTARNREHVSTASHVVAVLWEPPVIDVFSASSTDLPIGNGVALDFSARNVDVLRILRNGSEVFRSEQPTGIAQSSIQEEMTTFLLEVSNPLGTVTRELIVHGGRPPSLVRFAVQPRVWLGAVQQGMISWEVRDATSMRLDYQSSDSQQGRRDLLAGALQPVGSMPIEISGQGGYELHIQNSYGSSDVWRAIEVARDEWEPNDTIETRNSPGLGVRGVLERAGDVDFFERGLDLSPSGLRLALVGPSGTGCPFDAEIALFSLTGEMFASGDGCATIEVSMHDALEMQLGFGSFFYSVSSDSGATGL